MAEIEAVKLGLTIVGASAAGTSRLQSYPVRWHYGGYYNGTGASSARYVVEDFVDHGDGTFSWNFRKAGGFGNTDAVHRSRDSDGLKEACTPAYKFCCNEDFSFNHFNPATAFDGVSSFKYWVTDSGACNINPTADTYVQFLYDNGAPVLPYPPGP